MTNLLNYIFLLQSFQFLFNNFLFFVIEIDLMSMYHICPIVVKFNVAMFDNIKDESIRGKILPFFNKESQSTCPKMVSTNDV